MTTWKTSTTVNGTEVRSRELAGDARHKVSGTDQWVETIHPYDLARYHFAHSSDGLRWDIYREADHTHIGDYKGSVTGGPMEALKACRELDATVTAHIDLS